MRETDLSAEGFFPAAEEKVVPLFDLSVAILQICEAIELDPNLIREIRLRAPRSLEVIAYRVNEDGEKFVDEDGYAAVRQITRTFSTAGLDALR